MAETMLAQDSISAKRAECYITIGDNRYNFMSAIDLEARLDKTKVEVPILGQSNMGNKSTGSKGSGSATFHYNTSIFREAMLRFQDTGEDFYFDIQITNEDKTAANAGAQTLILKDCNLDSIVVAKFDADGDYLDEDFDFTFEYAQMPQQFNILPGMQA